jgi:hypothetical protein
MEVTEAVGPAVGWALVGSGVGVGVAAAGGRAAVAGDDPPGFAIVDVWPLGDGNADGAVAPQDATMTARTSKWTNRRTATPSGATWDAGPPQV